MMTQMLATSWPNTTSKHTGLWACAPNHTITDQDAGMCACVCLRVFLCPCHTAPLRSPWLIRNTACNPSTDRLALLKTNDIKSPTRMPKSRVVRIMESSCTPAPPSLQQREELLCYCSRPVGRIENNHHPGLHRVKQQTEPGQRAPGYTALREGLHPGSPSHDFWVVVVFVGFLFFLHFYFFFF